MKIQSGQIIVTELLPFLGRLSWEIEQTYNLQKVSRRDRHVHFARDSDTRTCVKAQPVLKSKPKKEATGEKCTARELRAIVREIHTQQQGLFENNPGFKRNAQPKFKSLSKTEARKKIREELKLAANVDNKTILAFARECLKMQQEQLSIQQQPDEMITV